MTKNARMGHPSPGEYLKTHLASREMKNADLAERLGRSAQYVTDIIKGKKVMDVDLAIELARALPDGPDANGWMDIAIKHRLSSLEPTRSDVLSRFDYAKELIKLKWIDGSKSPSELEKELKAFWELQDKAANFKISLAHTVNGVAKRAWAIQNYREANSQKYDDVPMFNHSNMEDLFGELKGLMHDESGVRQVPATLKKYGIRFIVVPNPKQCAVDGIASLNDGKPYIGMSLRIARLDSFWFTLWHELMHIYHRHEETAPSVADAPSESTDAEREADAEAAEQMLPSSEYADFIFNSDLSFKSIDAESKRLGIHQSILLGRLKKDHILHWSQFAREHPVIRDEVLQAVVN